MRIAASAKARRVSATYVVDRFGSASRGHPAATAGEALGKRLRTLHLRDCLGNPSFRTEILDPLNQDESVHSLERAGHTGSIGAKRGRATVQLAAISGALSLLAHTIMAWNTQNMQVVTWQPPSQFPGEVVDQIASVAHADIDVRGIFTVISGSIARLYSTADKRPPCARRRRNQEKRRIK